MPKLTEGNLYVNTSDLYDLDDRAPIYDDLGFYEEYAGETSGEILELASGTGRVSLHLAGRLERNVICLEYSRQMLDVFIGKLKTSHSWCSARIKLIHGDMSAFELNKQFEYVIIPWRALQWLTTKDQAAACLKHVYRHLKQGGLFLFDVFYPGIYDEHWIGKEVISYQKEINKTHIIRSTVNLDYDNSERYIRYLSRYKILRDNMEHIKEDVLTIKYYSYGEIVTMLHEAGFTIRESYGYYDKRPVGEGDEMIFVCTK